MTITCVSHTLSEMERHYLAVEKEAFGCLWAVEWFEKYLLGRPFVLHMDQHALRQVLGSPSKAESVRKSLSMCVGLSALQPMISCWPTGRVMKTWSLMLCRVCP